MWHRAILQTENLKKKFHLSITHPVYVNAMLHTFSLQQEYIGTEFYEIRKFFGPNKNIIYQKIVFSKVR